MRIRASNCGRCPVCRRRQHAPALADASFKGNEEPHPVLLTRKGTDALITSSICSTTPITRCRLQGAPAGSLGALDDGDGSRAAAERTRFAGGCRP